MRSDKTLPEESTKPFAKLGHKESLKPKPNNGAILGLNSKELQIKSEEKVAENQSQILRNEVNLTKFYIIITFIVAFSIFIFAASMNPGVFTLEESTSKILNQAVNAVVLLVIPFLFGAIGAIARILVTDLEIKQKGMLIISSGLLAIFSWVAIKSDLLFSSQVTNVEAGFVNIVAISEISSFYSSSLIAIIVGILSANFYISILSRVELQLARSKRMKSV